MGLYNENVLEALEDLKIIKGRDLRDFAEFTMDSYGDRNKEEGRLEERQQLILNMLKEKADISFVAKVTGLSLKEIKKLKNGGKLTDIKEKTFMDFYTKEDMRDDIKIFIQRDLLKLIAKEVRKNHLKLAKKMLKDNIDLKSIQKVTSLSLKEIKKLKNRKPKKTA